MARNGFTLVELMVVIALIALAAGAVILTVGAPGSGPADSATRFASRLAAARDEAVLAGRPVSAWVSASGYGFERYREGRWEPMAAKPFRTVDWPPGTKVAMARSGEGRARVRFDNLGMADPPLAVRLGRDGRSASVRVAVNGDVTVE